MMDIELQVRLRTASPSSRIVNSIFNCPPGQSATKTIACCPKTTVGKVCLERLIPVGVCREVDALSWC